MPRPKRVLIDPKRARPCAERIFLPYLEVNTQLLSSLHVFEIILKQSYLHCESTVMHDIKEMNWQIYDQDNYQTRSG